MNLAKKQSVVVETNKVQDTKKLAALFFDTIVGEHKKHAGALVISLEGDLGAGKTTFMQGLADHAGITESVQSPTFVIMKFYQLSRNAFPKLLIHIDAYRITSKDLLLFGWKEFLKNKNAIICIEWGDRVKSILPKDAMTLRFFHDQKDHRTIELSYANKRK